MFVSAFFLLEERLYPTHGLRVHRRRARETGRVAVAVVPNIGSPAQQPHGGGVGWPAHLVTHPDRLRLPPDSDPKVEQRLRRLGATEQSAAAPAEDHAARQEAVRAAPPPLAATPLDTLPGPPR